MCNFQTIVHDLYYCISLSMVTHDFTHCLESYFLLWTNSHFEIVQNKCIFIWPSCTLVLMWFTLASRPQDTRDASLFWPSPNEVRGWCRDRKPWKQMDVWSNAFDDVTSVISDTGAQSASSPLAVFNDPKEALWEAFNGQKCDNTHVKISIWHWETELHFTSITLITQVTTYRWFLFNGSNYWGCCRETTHTHTMSQKKNFRRPICKSLFDY